MAFTTWRLRDSVVGLFLAPLCLLLLSPIAGVETPAYALPIEMSFYHTIVPPSGTSGNDYPTFSVSADGPTASFARSAGGSGGSATVSGSVDLSAGELRAFTSVSGPYSAFANVGLNDVLTFSWEDPTRLDPITIFVTATHDSIFSGSSATASRAGNIGYDFGGATWFESFNCDGCFGPLHISNTQTVLLSPSVSYALGFSMYIGAGTNYGTGTATFDAGHTAGFSFELPQGATFVSNSGYFLTGAPAAVPEPGTVWLLGIGLIGMAALTHFTKWKRCGAASTL
ncbi:MAG: PEP-CTERM sorting domain-containing protein [Nitrospira sp.]|nr:PEP-CTERM sorting domain-containing protein [Nitrospira sp.]